MAEKENLETSEAQIAVHWQEEEYYYPSAQFIAQANMTDPTIYDRFSLDNFPNCYKEYADLLTWYEYWHTTLDTSDAPCFKWFVGGKINASYNCVDRHLAKNKNKTAIHFVPELEQEKTEHITYQELYVRVNEMAALLQDFCGLKAGDRVTLHLPMTAELPITMLALARLGVIHSQVFGGFSGKAAADRVVDSGSDVLITIDAYYRGGHLIDHKEKADVAAEAAAKDGHPLKKILVWQRYPGKNSTPTPMVEGRDYFVNDLLKCYYGKRVDPVPMPAEAPLFLMYTSGTTGKPKGCQHSTGGYLAYVTGTSKYVQDIHPEDVYWCLADIGWITGHSYIVYGPLALAASTVIYEGIPNYPDAGRPWRIAQDLDVNIFHTAPTAIRALRKIGPDEPKKYNYHFKHMTTVGEPIEPAVWKWYHKEVGKGEAIIVDTWWQTETGGIMISPLAGITPTKPSFATMPLMGIHPVILDNDGKELHGNSVEGNLCIRYPWPGIARTIWGDHKRFKETYFSSFPNHYFTGDGVKRDEDGYYRILGRVDDVINVSGHRLGTAEIENAINEHPLVNESAVVGFTHPIKGQGIYAYVVCTEFSTGGAEGIKTSVLKTVAKIIGPFAKPDKIQIVTGLPKTRSGKIMRRILRKIAENEMDNFGDTTTLLNPEIVEEIVQGAKEMTTA